MTRNAVPRDGDTTATCGTALKRWYKGFFNNVDADAGNKSAITTLQRSTAYAVGDILYTGELHAKYFLKCTTAGTTGSTEPSFSGVVSGDTVTDGTAVFTVQTKISLEEQEAKFVDDLLTALQTTGSLPSGTAFGATTLLSKIISQMNSDDGVQYNLTNSSAWYVKLGAKYGGLIIQGGKMPFTDNVVAGSDYYHEHIFPISFSTLSYTIQTTAIGFGGTRLITAGTSTAKDRSYLYAYSPVANIDYSQHTTYIQFWAIGI